MPCNADDSGFDQPSLDELITLLEAAELSGLSASHLQLLVRRGDVWGTKLGHNWLTTAQVVRTALRGHRISQRLHRESIRQCRTSVELLLFFDVSVQPCVSSAPSV
jgi:hypothetical protein